MRHLLATATVVALLSTTGGTVGAQEASPEPGASPSPEQLAAAEERLATATCLGQPATIVAIAGFETLGTSGADVIVGTEGDDVIRGEGGNDRICAGPGADLVEGGAGNDQIDGGLGNDQIDGGLGNDQLDGGASNDIINGGKGADMVLGAAGNDRLSGAGGDDTLDGGMGNDVCTGGKGNDWLPGCNDKRRTKGTLVIRKNTTLKGPHRGPIVIDANRVTLDCGGHTVIGKGAGYGILLEGRKGVTVKNCDVTNFSHGIRVTESQRNTVSHNRMHDNAQHGLAVNMSDKNKVISNVAIDNGFGRHSTFGFDVQTSHGNVFKQNIATGNSQAGFNLVHESNRNTFVNNTVVGTGSGFQVDGDGNTFHGNHVTDVQYNGFASIPTADNNVFTDNTVIGTSNGEGFNMQGAGNTYTGNSSDDNAGVGFNDASVPGANTYEGNSCYGNREGASRPEGLCDDTVPAEPEPTTEPGDNADAEGEPTAEE